MMTLALGPLIAAGNIAEVFACGEGKVVKLYRPSPAAKRAAFREAAIQAQVESTGLPVPAVHGVTAIGDRWGVVFDRVEAQSFEAGVLVNPAALPDYLQAMARLQARIHGHPAIPFASLKLRLAADIERTTHLDAPRKRDLLAGLARLPDGDRLCHGDFHPRNILGDAERPVVIDWPDATRGPPAADACRSYMLLRIHAALLATPHLDAYCQASGLTVEAILAWLPTVAAAKLAENVPGETAPLLALLAAGTGPPSR